MLFLSKPGVILQIFDNIVYWLECEQISQAVAKEVLKRELNAMLKLVYYDYNLTIDKWNPPESIMVHAIFQPVRTIQYVHATSNVKVGGGSEIFYSIINPLIVSPYSMKYIPYDRDARKVYAYVESYVTPKPIWDIW
jgi:hypothetical protein